MGMEKKVRYSCFYLRRAFEVHARHRKSSNVHGDAPVEVERPDYEKEASTYNWSVEERCGGYILTIVQPRGGRYDQNLISRYD